MLNQKSSVYPSKRGVLCLVALAACATAALGCSSAPDDEGSTSEGVCSEAYDWHDFPSGQQCVGGVEGFYGAHFGAASGGIPGLAAYPSVGSCETPGACLLWVDNLPSSAHWERLTGTPQLFDMIVFPPVSGNPYGHVAVVDHVSNGQVFVMDDNYDSKHPLTKATCPHTVYWAPYGFYRIKPTSTAPDCSHRSGWNCGDDGVINGAANTKYNCKLGQVAPVSTEVCSYGCKIEPNGVADICNPPPTPDCSHRSGWNCGNDGVINGNPGTNYLCKYGQVAPVTSTVCLHGYCITMPDGDPDECPG